MAREINNASEIIGLQTLLDGKSATGHIHAESEVTNLTTDLSGKANTTHTHTESDITSLVTDLSGKAATTHSHAISDVTNLQTTLNGKANAIFNYSTTNQSPTAATRTYITGSAISIPTTKLKIGTMLKWKFNMTKTAAGIAASTFDICFGTTGTTSDVARVSFTKPAGTAAVDEGWIEIEAIVRGPLSASGYVTGEFMLMHNLAATGHAIIPCVVVNTLSAAFDVTTPTYVGICITSGASDAITIKQVMSEVVNL